MRACCVTVNAAASTLRGTVTCRLLVLDLSFHKLFQGWPYPGGMCLSMRIRAGWLFRARSPDGRRAREGEIDDEIGA